MRWEAHLSIKATAVVKKETKLDPKKPNDKAYYASLSVLNGNGKEYGLPRHLCDFREVVVLLRREAGVTHEQLHERFAAYERGEEISIPLTLEESDEAIKNLGSTRVGPLAIFMSADLRVSSHAGRAPIGEAWEMPYKLSISFRNSSGGSLLRSTRYAPDRAVGVAVFQFPLLSTGMNLFLPTSLIISPVMICPS